MRIQDPLQVEILHLLHAACHGQLRKLTLSFREIRQQVVEWETGAIRRALANLLQAGLVATVPNLLDADIYRITPAGREALAAQR